MGGIGKTTAELGCDYVSGLNEFTARRGYIYVFLPRYGAVISSFKEQQVISLNDTWAYTPGAATSTIANRTYCNIPLESGDQIWFDGPVTSITLSAGSGIVYYAD